MPTKLEKPLATSIYAGWTEFRPAAGSTYVYGTSVEQRSVHPGDWEAMMRGVSFMRIWASEEACEDEFSSCRIDFGGPQSLSLRNGEQLRAFAVGLPSERVYLDITGLSHSVWAALLRALVSAGKRVSAVYVEPRTYSFSKTPTEAEIFDLSEQIRDVRPLPGFTSLADPANEDAVVFVPLLGFEGHRFAHVLEKVQPPGTIIPVVGVPGFRPEYPFHTYLGNRNVLKTNMHTKVRFAVANSASDVFYLLSEIQDEYAGFLMKVAPIGTKPHALGAILFAINSKEPVEVVYDHPIRKPGRTTGNANILVYDTNCILGL